MNEKNCLPVTIGEMVAALRRFSRCSENDYERLIMTEAAAELEKVQEARRRAERLARYATQPAKVKPRKVELAGGLDAMVYSVQAFCRYQEEKRRRDGRPRLATVIVEGGKEETVDLRNVTATPEYVDRMIREATNKEAKGTGEIGECCICGYKAHSLMVRRLHDCNDCGKKRTCEHVPRLGADVRINCHLWEKEAE